MTIAIPVEEKKKAKKPKKRLERVIMKKGFEDGYPTRRKKGV